MLLKEKISKIFNNQTDFIDGKIVSEKYFKNNYPELYEEFLLYEFKDELSFREKIFCILNDLKERPICQICKKNKVKWIGKLKTYGIGCCIKCISNHPTTIEKRKNTNLDKYGHTNFLASENGKEKIKNINMEKYGFEVACKNKDISKKISETKINKSFEEKEDIKSKVIKTNQERYGVDFYFNNELGKKTKIKKYKDPNFNNRKKSKETCIERYGGSSPSCSKNVIEKSKLKKLQQSFEFMIENFKDIKPIFTTEKYISFEERNFLCLKCNSEFYIEKWMDQNSQIRCPKCYPYNKTKAEKDLESFIVSNNIEIKTNDRSIIKPKELDLFIPNHNLAIEYNGLYWHSYGKDDIENKNYHLEKTNLTQEQGIKLLHIFENEWEDLLKRDIWKSIIKSNLGLNKTIGARKCEIREVDSKESTKFLNLNHLQGSCNASIKLGLFYENELISIITMSKSRFNKNYDWEIVRFANKINLNVIGGFSKLLKYFRQNYSGSIITYADKRYSNGDLYRTNGFEELKDSKPNYFYIKQKKLYSRIQFQKHKLKDQLELFDDNISEAENMFNNGYRRIWDCGNKVFVLTTY